eukprot:scaffold76881_cov36-Phaeocystis_antarctica.AAC.1
MLRWFEVVCLVFRPYCRGQRSVALGQPIYLRGSRPRHFIRRSGKLSVQKRSKAASGLARGLEARANRKSSSGWATPTAKGARSASGVRASSKEAEPWLVWLSPGDG